MNNKEIGQYLRSKRTERKLTQAELAKQFGVTYQAVSRWENGDSVPDIETLIMIADFYQVTLDSILQRDMLEIVEVKESNLMPHNYSFLILFVYFVFQILGVLGLWIAERGNLFIWDILGIISAVMFAAVSLILLYSYYTILSKRNNIAKQHLEFALRGTNIIGIFSIIIAYNRVHRYMRLLNYTDFVTFIIQALIITLGPALLYIVIQYVIYRVRYQEHFPTYVSYLFPPNRKLFKILLIVFIIALLPFIVVQLTPSFTILLFLILALL